MSHHGERRVRSTFTGALCTALLLGGCSFLNPITTMEEYAPGDGIRIDLTEDVTAENLMILTEGEGLPGHLLGAIDNNSEQPVVVTVVLGSDGYAVPVDVPANGLVNFTDSQVVIPRVDEPPGATLTSVILSEQSGAYTVYIPVLDGTLPPYDRYLDRH
ncbi:hypothetical protein KZX45_07640 [Georgenia sp. EYE_87]|uniref:hypothetical protein n=1 Tax=Georgenia sp. EYE_87 TaxID=2853448 RepID=UPI002005D858|nr:hypothetical protein [Georgenia sp. EYE_87]MCK6210411.1 hypothetical protein [Georgenia sp. EYE_87]